PQTYTKYFSKNNKFPIAFRQPQLYKNDKILALRETPLLVNSIVEIDTSGSIKELVKTGRQASPNFSYSADKIVWDEVRADGRFKLRSFSIINSYDLTTQKYIQLTKKTRLFSPDLNSDGTKIAAVEINLKNEISLVILDADNGEEILRMPSPENRMLS